MISPDMFCDPAVIVRAGTATDRYNRTGADWANATRVATSAALDLGATGAEKVSDRDEATTSGVAFFPPGTDIRSTDRIEADGMTWQVVGRPVPMRWIDGQIESIRCRIQSAVG